MIQAKLTDRDRIVEILAHSFEKNQSVNFIVKQDEMKMERIKRLMSYAVKMCSAFGKVVLSDDRNACALVIHEKKGLSFRSMLWDLQLIFGVVGLRNVIKVLKRESLIKDHHPLRTFYYIWFIGVHPVHKGQGIGSVLLNELIADADDMNMDIYLETSTTRNVPWYEKFGFQIFHEIDIGYKLFFLKRLLHKETETF